MKKKSPTHKTIFRHICENLDQELNSPACREIRKHMDGCPECIEYLKSMKATVALYRAYPAPPLPESSRKKLRSILQLKRR